jgi:hypothetical protein
LQPAIGTRKDERRCGLGLARLRNQDDTRCDGLPLDSVSSGPPEATDDSLMDARLMDR